MIQVQDVFSASVRSGCVLCKCSRPGAPLQLQLGEFVSAVNPSSMQLSVIHWEGYGAVTVRVTNTNCECELWMHCS